MLRYTVGTVVLLALVSVAAADSPLSDKGSTRTRPGLALTQLSRATATTAAHWAGDYCHGWQCRTFYDYWEARAFKRRMEYRGYQVRLRPHGWHYHVCYRYPCW